MSTLGKEILKAVKTTIKTKDTGKVLRGGVDVKDLRAKLKLTQVDFSDLFQINIETLRAWEQGKRVPDSISSAYLVCIYKAPDVISALLGKKLGGA